MLVLVGVALVVLVPAVGFVCFKYLTWRADPATMVKAARHLDICQCYPVTPSRSSSMEIVLKHLHTTTKLHELGTACDANGKRLEALFRRLHRPRRFLKRFLIRGTRWWQGQATIPIHGRRTTGGYRKVESLISHRSGHILGQTIPFIPESVDSPPPIHVPPHLTRYSH